MRIAVFGTGAVGGYFGGRLAEAGQDVTFIARGETARALRDRGLRVDSVAGDFHLASVQVEESPAHVGEPDLILLGTKAWQVSEAARAMLPMVGDSTAVLPLQNGVEAVDELCGVLGPEHVLGGLCRIMAFAEGPGHIRHAGVTPAVMFGELDNDVSDRVVRIREAFEAAAGVEPNVPADIHVAIWEKFLLIAALSGLGAVARTPVGVLRSVPETRGMLETLMREIRQVGLARGVQLPADVVVRTLALIDGFPESGTASMQRDIIEGRPSELESQTGAVVRLGRQASVPTPLNEFVYGCLCSLERRARGTLSF